MKPIRIDFAPRTLRRAIALTSLPAWLGGAAGIALCIAAAVAVLDQAEKNRAGKLELRQLEARLAERQARRAPPKKIVIPAAQASAVNGVILRLNLPWSDVFDAIEEATPATIALLSLEPDAKKHLVKGTAEAKTSDEMIAYIEQLKKQEFLERVILARHEINEQDPHKPMRFQFEAQWKEARP